MNDVTPELVRAFAPTGTLRCALNLGNPVLAHSKTAADKPAGVTIDLSRAFAALLNVPCELLQFDGAAKAVAALADGSADVGYMAIDPLRAETTHFTPPYVQIEGFYAVPGNSPLRSAQEVDRAGHRIVIGKGSAYGLHLARAIQHATLVEVPTSEEVADKMLAGGFEVASGVRQGLESDVRRLGGLRLLPERFMVIRQAMAMPRGRSVEAAAFLDAFIAKMKAEGFVEGALRRHGIEGAEVAP